MDNLRLSRQFSGVANGSTADTYRERNTGNYARSHFVKGFELLMSRSKSRSRFTELTARRGRGVGVPFPPAVTSCAVAILVGILDVRGRGRKFVIGL